MMRESQNRIRSMALIHQTLYQSKDFARVDFQNFLDSLVPTLISSYGVGIGARQAHACNPSTSCFPSTPQSRAAWWSTN